jgi:hypothetical protein
LLFWDSRTLSLEAQALEPVRNLEEMRGLAFSEDESIPEVLARLERVPEYAAPGAAGARTGEGIAHRAVHGEASRRARRARNIPT